MTFRTWNRSSAFNKDAEEASSQATSEAEDYSAEPDSDESQEEDTSSLFSEMTDHYEGVDSAEDSEGEDSPTPKAAEPKPEVAPAKAEEAPAEAPAPASESAPSPKLPESEEVAATAPPTPVQPQPLAVEQQPAATPTQPTQEEIQARLEEHRKIVLPQLQDRYKLDDETVAELESNPGKVLPSLLAQMHYDMTQAIFSGVMSQIPQVVQQQTKQAQREAELESKFFGKYPGLRNHQDIVQQALSAALQSELAKSYDEVEQLAATMAAIRLKVPLEQLMGQSTPMQSSPPPVAPQPANVARPIAPTSSGAPIAPQAQGKQQDLWGEMVEFELQQSG
jgi:hypothetical protein